MTRVEIYHISGKRGDFRVYDTTSSYFQDVVAFLTTV